MDRRMSPRFVSKRNQGGVFIHTAHTLPNRQIRAAGGYVRWVESLVRGRYGWQVNWQTQGTVAADISNGCWRVKCPHCPGAQVYEPPAPFFCVDCLMAANEGKAMQVTMPVGLERVKIEAALLARPSPVNMNWLASRGETLEDLIMENIEHGIHHTIEVIHDME